MAQKPVLIKDIHPGSLNSTADDLDNTNVQAIGIGSKLFIIRNDGISGDELWCSDGTEKGTYLVKDLTPGPGSTKFRRLWNLNNTLCFEANEGIWRSDGTSEGTTLITNYNGIVTVASDKIEFGNSGVIHGGEILISDGTESRTKIITNIELFSNDSLYDSLRFRVSPDNLTFMNGILYFSASTDDKVGTELWRSDGTFNGTYMVKDINPANYISSYPSKFFIVDDILCFVAQDGEHGYELWRSDGTAEGTELLKDIDPGDAGPEIFHVVKLKNVLHFIANDGEHGYELWRSNGTTRGTYMVKDINPGDKYAMYPHAEDPSPHLIVVNDTIYFGADDGVHGLELWRSNGTEIGTSLVKDINPGSKNSNPRHFAAVSNILYFSAASGDLTNELWRSNRKENGTYLVNNIDPIFTDDPTYLTNVDGTLFFEAYAFKYGYELYKLEKQDFCFQVSVSGSYSVCQGSSTKLTATVAGGSAPYTYIWKLGTATVGANDSALAASQPGNYSLEVIDSKGCKGGVTGFVITALDSPAIPSISASVTAVVTGGSATLQTTVTSGVTTQWLRNDSPISGATQTTYQASQAGNYAVQVTTSQGCTAKSRVITINLITALTQTELGSALTIQIAPNPSSNQIKVGISANSGKSTSLTLLLHDGSGRVLQQKAVKLTSEQTETIDLSMYQAGSYLLTVIHEDNRKTYRIIRQ